MGIINNKYYKRSAVEYIQRLRAFRLGHEQKKIRVNGIEWQYISSGQGEETLLLIAGGLGVGEAFFLHIMELEKEYKVIVPTLPSVSTIEDMIKGIISILEAEEVYRFNVLGQSFGGFLAQEILRRLPGKVNKVVLSHTAAITPDLNNIVLESKKRDIENGIKLIKILPLFLLRTVLKMKINKNFSVMDEVKRKFWSAYFSELIDSKDKENEIAIYKSMIDYIDNYRYSGDDARNFDCQVLILDSDSDRSFDDSQRQVLKELYRSSQTYTFKGTGHLSIIVAYDEYMRVLKEFLER